MSEATLIAILRLTDLALWGLSRLPERNVEHEEALQKLRDMIEAGETPTEADFEDVAARIAEQSQIRDNIIAMKGEV